MNNIIFFPRKVAAPARGCVIKETVRPVLVAVWHRNPVNGRLECHWVADHAPGHGEGLRSGTSDRRAA
ncbi:MAG: hypothetical protein BGP04_25505 [Rhizobiales bacterium 62-17]|nr:hypothetical protein [Hyphomicrobiales bacterium]OJY00857.1 MAG: hypothetical protein BGP04_25505 [Rhizobiales bacterium 62-17]